ncbi:MAG TPA: molybdopterin converting factor subunit 1 [Candidatus Dormibacteraeota bacterium]|nr:molybdopterin converting factor subunit 1 [Candidatus Dormibacteraeota bacterium]
MAVAIAIRVRFFARLRELAGVETQDVKASTGASVASVYAAMRAYHPALPPQDSVRAALNHEFVEWDTAVAEGDEVAFIPPVSGGEA